MILKRGDRGSLVSILQLGLMRSGYFAGVKDGIFGANTETALTRFQENHGLAPDGIAGRLTMEKIRPYIVGYTKYTVKEGDTLFSIANRLYSTVALIENANQNINALNLIPGTQITVPFNFSLVPTDIAYSSLLCELICEGLAVRYPFIELSSAGKSVLGRYLTTLKIGRGDSKVFLNASHHANEWITTPLALKYVEDFAMGVVNAGTLGGQNSEYMFDKNTLFVMPMVNPDGVDLVTGALEKDTTAYRDAVNISQKYPAISFPSGWKANILGTDLNLNYPAGWEQAREIKFAQGFVSPAPRDFVGVAPLSAPESSAVHRYSLQNDFNITISLHTQGEEIYWQFLDYAPDYARILGLEMSSLSGYSLTNPAESSGYAGYKDWFLRNYRRPGYTVEAGRGINPLPISDFAEIYPGIASIISAALAFGANNYIEEEN